MPTLNRRDQAHASKFLSRRLSSALIHDDPDSTDAPMRKLGVATFSSVMVAVLAMAGFGVYGLLRPGGATAWKNGQSLIVESGTGTRYLYAGGQLHPVLNYASARLALGQPTLSIASVSTASLGGTPRGLAIGIPGAPEELPTPATLVIGPWSVCSLPSVDAAGGIHPYVRVAAGLVPPSGAVPAANRAVLVVGQDGTLYLVWNDHRLRVPDGAASLTALGYASAGALPVGDAWLSAMPQGPDLAAPQLAHMGAAGPSIGTSHSRVGQIYVSGGPGAAAQYYVMLGDGLAPVTLTLADLLLAVPGAASLYPASSPAAISVSAAQAAVIRSQNTVDTTDLPSRPPTLTDTTGGLFGVCESYDPGSDGVPTAWTVPVPASAMPSAQGGGASQVGVLGTAVADQVQIPPGRGVVVQAVPAPGVSGGTLYLVTDQGMKYPLPDINVLSPLGLAGVTPVRIPVAVVQLLRTGPTLDQQAAMMTVSP